MKRRIRLFEEEQSGEREWYFVQVTLREISVEQCVGQGGSVECGLWKL